MWPSQCVSLNGSPLSLCSWRDWVSPMEKISLSSSTPRTAKTSLSVSSARIRSTRAGLGSWSVFWQTTSKGECFGEGFLTARNLYVCRQKRWSCDCGNQIHFIGFSSCVYQLGPGNGSKLHPQHLVWKYAGLETHLQFTLFTTGHLSEISSN